MEKTMVPWEYGIEMTGHRALIFYGKWIFKKRNLSLPLFLSFFVQCWFFSSSTFFYGFVFVLITLLAFGFYYRYNQIDKHLRNRALHHIISGELKANRLLCYDETFIEEKKMFEKKIVKFIFIFEIWFLVLFIIILFIVIFLIFKSIV